VTAKILLEMSKKDTAFVDAELVSDANVSVSEVVRAGLRVLQERKRAAERRLRTEVVPVCDAMKTNPKRGIPANKAFAEVRARHARRLKAGA